MVKELEKDVLKTVKDQNGNHVIQKVIDRVPMQYIQRISGATSACYRSTPTDAVLSSDYLRRFRSHNEGSS
jgi:hypothetical protein